MKFYLLVFNPLSYIEMKNIKFILLFAIALFLMACNSSENSDNSNYNSDLIIKNGFVVTVDSAGNLYKNGAIAIKGDEIISIGNSEEILKEFSAPEVIDAQQKIVMPGFVNSHTHMGMTLFRGLADDLYLHDWLTNYIFPAENEFVDAEFVSLGSQLAMIEMIHSGTTCFNNMYFYQGEVAKAAKQIGMRGIVCESLIDFPVPNAPTPQDGIKYIKSLIQEYQNDPLITVGVAVHSPYTCQPELIVEGKKLADEHSLPYHIHVAETKWEVDTIKRTYGLTPVQYLDSLGVMTENVIAAHCVWLTEKDIEIIANQGVGVAHNPECNMKISSGVAPIPELVAANAQVGLGTDGAASNNNLNMIEEMHVMSLLHKLNTMNPTTLPAKKIVETSTIGSATVIGKEKEVGSLEVGKKADIIIIDNNEPNAVPIYDVYSAIVYTILGNEVTDVIINGKIIMRDDVILTTDEQKIKEDARAMAKDIKEAISKK